MVQDHEKTDQLSREEAIERVKAAALEAKNNGTLAGWTLDPEHPLHAINTDALKSGWKQIEIAQEVAPVLQNKPSNPNGR